MIGTAEAVVNGEVGLLLVGVAESQTRNRSGRSSFGRAAPRDTPDSCVSRGSYHRPAQRPSDLPRQNEVGRTAFVHHPTAARRIEDEYRRANSLFCRRQGKRREARDQTVAMVFYPTSMARNLTRDRARCVPSNGIVMFDNRYVARFPQNLRGADTATGV